MASLHPAAGQGAGAHCPHLQRAIDNGEIQSVLSAQDLARSLTGFGYVMMQMINQPQRPSREEVTDFLFKYVTAPIQAS